MFTDIVGYTALTQSNESQAMEILERHNRLLRPLFSKSHGREVKSIGDSFLVEFDSALDALRCATEIQSYLHDYSISSRDEWKIKLRIGVHLGDVIHKDGDVLGDAVNIASRIEPLAEPEGVCISAQVYDQVHNKFELPLLSMGERSLKNVEEPIVVYMVEMPWEAATATAKLDRRRVAVLPFVSISPDSGDEYFADGLTEEMIGRLSLVPGLEVIARTSVMGYKKKDKTVSQIGKDLRVGTLLEGSVRKAGNKIRVTAQLIDANTEGHLWMEKYDRGIEDIFAVQSELAEKVADSLELKLTAQYTKSMQRGDTLSAEAHALYLKGRFYLQRWEEESLKSSVKLFEEALTHDPSYALAYCGLARAYSVLGFEDFLSPEEARARANAYAERALSLEPSLAEARFVMALTSFWNYDFKGWLKELEKAVEVDPNFAEAYNYLANHYASTNRIDEALRSLRRQLELDPLSVVSSGNAGTSYLYLKKYDDAIKHLSDAVELDPANSFYLGNLGLAYMQKGMDSEGLAKVRRAYETSGACARDLAYAYVKVGQPEEARKILNSMLEAGTEKRVSPVDVAGVYSVLGEKDKAIEWLERAYNERSFYLPLSNIDFVFDNVRNDPRYQALIKKIGLVAVV
jgi:pentatricopeptide repeat protein